MSILRRRSWNNLLLLAVLAGVAWGATTVKESTNVSGGIYVSGFAKQDFSSMGEHVGSAYQGGFGFGTLCVWGGDRD